MQRAWGRRRLPRGPLRGHRWRVEARPGGGTRQRRANAEAPAPWDSQPTCAGSSIASGSRASASAPWCWARRLSQRRRSSAGSSSASPNLDEALVRELAALVAGGLQEAQVGQAEGLGPSRSAPTRRPCAPRRERRPAPTQHAAAATALNGVSGAPSRGSWRRAASPSGRSSVNAAQRGDGGAARVGGSGHPGRSLQFLGHHEADMASLDQVAEGGKEVEPRLVELHEKLRDVVER